MQAYKPRGTCSREIDFDVRDGKIGEVRFVGGCPGNALGLAALLGWTAFAAAGAAPRARTSWRRPSSSTRPLRGSNGRCTPGLGQVAVAHRWPTV